MIKKWAMAGLLLCLVAQTGWAQKRASDESDKANMAAPKQFVTEHSGRFNGKSISYQVVAGETYIRDDEGQPTASFFNVAYLAKGGAASKKRPVTFLFNGGPGSASLWLHMGAFGPKRVVVPSDAKDDGAPPYPVVDNPDTILDVSDMVFIDPVGTGYSRALGEKSNADFYGVRQDADSIAAFIHQWISDNGRWNSPIYIAGESYGTLRMGPLLDALGGRRHQIGVNGVMLISAVLHYQNSRFNQGNIMSYVSFLPTYAATAWYHDQLPQKPENLEEFLDEVRDFARNDYATALIAGTRLDPQERQRIISKLHAYTGLKTDWLDKANMRIQVFRFFKELMRDDRQVVGRLDSRYLGEEPDAVGEFYETDPASASIGNAYVAAISDYFQTDLGVRMDRPYFASSPDAFRKWDWKLGDRAPNGGRFINVVPQIGQAMRYNKDMRVLVSAGYFDFATPFFGAENALSEVGLVPERIHYDYYRAGHMMYLHDESRDQFLKDIRAFIEEGAH
ncbi:peptidase S10 [Iodidimonas muriae]|uniref:Peptidase S10 n=1 Tax=Iodidimonas muriae TaxID=261467 RepID=A0ABQ2LGX4_9PROT|nr:peptidase S10 [Iodidimonas muriae]GER07712.1 peptidase S10 [Kordiimonadales bacterium JCM 17843]GGO14811.1 peptidase S10 [Iodidimonas muriae]